LKDLGAQQKSDTNEVEEDNKRKITKREGRGKFQFVGEITLKEKQKGGL